MESIKNESSERKQIRESLAVLVSALERANLKGIFALKESAQINDAILSLIKVLELELVSK